MSFGDIIRTLIEAAAAVFTIWCIFHEDRLIAFEERIAAAFKRRKLRVIRGGITSVYER